MGLNNNKSNNYPLTIKNFTKVRPLREIALYGSDEQIAKRINDSIVNLQDAINNGDFDEVAAIGRAIGNLSSKKRRIEWNNRRIKEVEDALSTLKKGDVVTYESLLRGVFNAKWDDCGDFRRSAIIIILQDYVRRGILKPFKIGRGEMAYEIV